LFSCEFTDIAIKRNPIITINLFFIIAIIMCESYGF
jgi:hypothetical protein